MFEFVNKALLPRTEKISTLSNTDFFLMESLTKFKKVNPSVIMIEHMHKVINVKDRKHDLAYGFLLNRMFEHFKVPCGNSTKGYSKQTFTLSMLEDNECVEWKGGLESKSSIV